MGESKIENSQKLQVLKIRKRNYQHMIATSRRLKESRSQSLPGLQNQNRLIFIKKKMANDIGAIYKIVDQSDKIVSEQQRATEKKLTIKEIPLEKKERDPDQKADSSQFCTIEKVEEQQLIDKEKQEQLRQQQLRVKLAQEKDLDKAERIQCYFRRIFGNEHINRQQMMLIIQTLEEKFNSNSAFTLERTLNTQLPVE